jgi:hypothetical protein
MRAISWWFGLAVVLSTLPVSAQNRLPLGPALSGLTLRPTLPGQLPLAGKWAYRSYNNTADLVGDNAARALGLIFGEGIFTFEVPSSTTLKGTLDMGGGYLLDLEGAIRPAASSAPLAVAITGIGRVGTPTGGWEYDYNGYLAYQWPNGVNQVPALVGSVIRARPHDGAPAGYVASFIAVMQP